MGQYLVNMNKLALKMWVLHRDLQTENVIFSKKMAAMIMIKFHWFVDIVSLSKAKLVVSSGKYTYTWTSVNAKCQFSQK
jgi:hypothetical protein